MNLTYLSTAFIIALAAVVSGGPLRHSNSDEQLRCTCTWTGRPPITQREKKLERVTEDRICSLNDLLQPQMNKKPTCRDCCLFRGPSTDEDKKNYERWEKDGWGITNGGASKESAVT
ncbi:hypothetical protein L208DRAFT_785559 [Tricholoma matsutake]|nr:hypothetical protein L208DRAFT_785559 [Tricholoma matsutake 945]